MKSIIVFCFTTIFTFAQSKSGIAKYGLVVVFDEGISKSEGLKDYYAKATEGAKLFTFSLAFNENESLFSLDNLLDKNATEVSFAKAFSSADDII